MSTTASKSKTSTSTVPTSAKPTTTSKASSTTAASIPKEPATHKTSSVKCSEFYMACRNSDIDAVRSSLPNLTLKEINKIEPNGSTALHAAAYYGNYDVVKLLLSKGAQQMNRNKHGNTPYDEAKTDDIKKLFQRENRSGKEFKNRFVTEKGPSYEWIFVDSDPSTYASFNRRSLWKCETGEEFNRLCRGIRRQYINEDGPLADVKHIEVVREFFDKALENNDPKMVVRAYSAETGFYRRVNTDLSQMPTHWSGTKHERNLASIMIFHPVFQNFSYTGESYRGMTMSSEDLKKYVVDTIFMNKTFLSTSKQKSKAEGFTESYDLSKSVGVLCKYLIKRKGTALEIENMSEFPLEEEVLILPYASFKVKRIQKVKNIKVGFITEIDVEEEEEEDEAKWTKGNSCQASHAHTTVHKSVHKHSSTKTTTSSKHSDGTYEKMFKDSQEKGKIDPADLAKWKQENFGVDPETDTYAKIWNNAKKGKLSKSDIVKWKKETGMTKEDNEDDDFDFESYGGGGKVTVFTASNEQSYATSKTYVSKEPFDMKKLMKKFEDDSDD